MYWTSLHWEQTYLSMTLRSCNITIKGSINITAFDYLKHDYAFFSRSHLLSPCFYQLAARHSFPSLLSSFSSIAAVSTESSSTTSSPQFLLYGPYDRKHAMYGVEKFCDELSSYSSSLSSSSWSKFALGFYWGRALKNHLHFYRLRTYHPSP